MAKSEPYRKDIAAKVVSKGGARQPRPLKQPQKSALVFFLHGPISVNDGLATIRKDTYSPCAAADF